MSPINGPLTSFWNGWCCFCFLAESFPLRPILNSIVVQQVNWRHDARVGLKLLREWCKALRHKSNWYYKYNQEKYWVYETSAMVRGGTSGIEKGP